MRWLRGWKILSEKFMAIMTADCTPILFYEKQAGIIGAAHAGWKGAISGIIENTVNAMIAMGAARASYQNRDWSDNWAKQLSGRGRILSAILNSRFGR